MAAAGHDVEKLWNYTPRELTGFLAFRDARAKRERGPALILARLAAHGDQKAVEKFLRDSNRE